MAMALFPFRKPTTLADFILRWYFDQHVDMVMHEMPFQDLAFLLIGQLVKDTAKPWTYLTV